jgi:sulfide:quinone oxidoreductase
MNSSKKPMHVLIAGAGVAALEAALALQKLASDEVSVELVAPETEFSYRPLAVAEPFRVGEVKRFPLERLVEAAGARLRRGSLASVDAERKIITLDDGQELVYDTLLLALGACPREAVAEALTFRGPQDGPALSALLDRMTAGEIRRIAFAIPSGSGWPLPLYELALLTAAHAVDRGTRNVQILLITPEDRPLGLFGSAASDAIAELLALRGIQVESSVTPIRFAGGALAVLPERRIEADAVVALPVLYGPPIPGIPQDDRGFVSIDEYAWVLGLSDVYAAGDMTQFPLKQGGIATQQADAAATSIAADAGADVKPQPFKPVLRGILLAGFLPRFLQSEATGARSVVDTEPLWWPPAKIVGRYLAPFLALHLGLAENIPPAARGRAVPVELELRGDFHPAPPRL